MGWLKQHNRITVSQLDHRYTQGSWMYKWVNTFGFCGHEERNGKKNGYWAVAGQPTVPAIDSKYLKWFLDNFTVRWETYQSIVWTVFIISILLLYFLFCVSIQSYWQWLRKLWIGFNNLKSFTVWITTNCGKFLKRWEYQTTLPAPWEIYAGQETTVRTRHGTMNWFKIGKGVHQGCILSPWLYAKYIMRNARLDDSQAGINIDRRNINNLRYADDVTLMAESDKELKSLLMKVKEENDKADLKLNIKITKIMATSPMTSWKIDGKTMETVTDFIFLSSKITADGDWSREIKRCFLLGRKTMTNLAC